MFKQNPVPDYSKYQYEFFQVPTSKLIIMNLCTLSFYELYWFYRNWDIVSTAEGTKINRVLRAAFAPITLGYLLRRMRVPHQNLIAVIYLLLSLVPARLPGALWLLGLLTFLPLVYIQDHLPQGPVSRQANAKYSTKEVIFAVLGGLVFLLALVGSFMPAEA